MHHSPGQDKSLALDCSACVPASHGLDVLAVIPGMAVVRCLSVEENLNECI
jgi:hypothetical protein